MSLRNDRTPEKSIAGGENIWPPRVAGLWPITKDELDQLETALEKPVDRDHLAHWVLTAISNAVKRSNLSSPARARERLREFAKAGRKWIDKIDSDPIRSLLIQRALQEGGGLQSAVAEHRTKVEELKATMAGICEQADSAAAELGRFIRKGGQRSTPPALTAFIETMIGIAKWNGIRPSTPQRDMDSQKPPAFFVFVKEALSIATDLIKSSEIPTAQKRPTVQSLRYVSDHALIRIIERKRGLIGNYREGARGLVEDAGTQPTPRQGRPRRR